MNTDTFEELDHRVRVMAKAYAGRCRGMALADLVQEGWVAVLQAQQTWDPTRGKSLYAYAHTAIWRRMRELSLRQRVPVSIPHNKPVMAEQPVGVPLPPTLRASSETPEAALIRREMRDELFKTIATMRYRGAVARVLLNGDAPRDLAKRYRARPRQLWAQTNKARVKIKQNPALRALSQP